jgi:GNAT superfamily N-acetyltransferase
MVRAGDNSGMGPLSIRAARLDDSETLFAIHRESATAAYAEIFPPDRYRFPDAQMRKVWVEALRSEDISGLIAERAGCPVGFTTVSPGWLRNLFVLPGEWGRGTGAALHDEAVALLRRHAAIAHLWVLEANDRARRFYEARGWRDDGGRSRSEFPPHPVELRYALRFVDGATRTGGSDPSRAPTHPRG